MIQLSTNRCHMKTKYLKIIIANLILLLGYQFKAQEFITGIGVDYQIGEKWEIGTELQTRYNRDDINTRSWIIQAKLSYKLFDGLYLSGTYRNTSTETLNHFSESDIETLDKNRYTANVTFKAKRFNNDWRLSHRLRYQYSEHDDSDKKEYLRYKMSFDYKLSKNVRPYLAAEPYYYLNKNKLKYARIYFGNQFNFNRTKLDIFLITETNLDKEIFALHYMLGVKANFNISASNKL